MNGYTNPSESAAMPAKSHFCVDLKIPATACLAFLIFPRTVPPHTNACWTGRFRPIPCGTPRQWRCEQSLCTPNALASSARTLRSTHDIIFYPHKAQIEIRAILPYTIPLFRSKCNQPAWFSTACTGTNACKVHIPVRNFTLWYQGQWFTSRFGNFMS